MKLVAIIHVGKSEKKEKVLLSQPSTKKIASFNSKLPQGNKLSLKIIFAVSHFSLLLRKKGRTGWWATTGVFSPSFTVSIAFVPFLYLLKCLDCVKQLSLKLQNCFLYTVLMKCIKLSVLAECHKCFMLRNTRKKQHEEQQWPLEFERMQMGIHLWEITIRGADFQYTNVLYFQCTG